MKLHRIKNVFFFRDKLNFLRRKESLKNKSTKNNLLNFMKSKQKTWSWKGRVNNSKTILLEDKRDFLFIRQRIDHYLYNLISQFKKIQIRKNTQSLLNIQLQVKGQEWLHLVHIKKNLSLIMKLKTKSLTITIFLEVKIAKRRISIHKTHQELK